MLYIICLLVLVWCYIWKGRKVRKIPKIIHKVFIQDDMKLNVKDRCPYTLEAHNSWETLNPDYEVRYYSGEDCRTFLRKHFDQDALNAFDAFVPYSYKCDFFRYCVLYVHGGYYTDWKMVLHEPLDKWIPSAKHFVASWDIFWEPIGGMCTGFIGAIPRLPILRTAIQMMINNASDQYYGRTYLEPTGPHMLVTAFAKHYKYPYDTEVDETGILIGKHEYGDGGTVLCFSSKKKITVKHPKLRTTWSTTGGGNDYWTLWNERRVYH